MAYKRKNVLIVVKGENGRPETVVIKGITESEMGDLILVESVDYVKWYTITHIPTGKRIGSDFSIIKHGIQAISEILETHKDFFTDEGYTEGKHIPEEIGKSVLGIIEKHRK